MSGNMTGGAMMLGMGRMRRAAQKQDARSEMAHRV